jgi:hypothetical protein
MFDVLFIYCIVVCVSGSSLIQTSQHWTTFKIFKKKTLSSSSYKASEPFLNSTYSFFLALFTIYVLHEIMNFRLFTFSYHYPIALLWCWVGHLDVKIELWCFVLSHPVRCQWTRCWYMPGFEQGQDTVGKVATFMVGGRFLLESSKNWFLGVDPLGQHVPPHVRYGTTCLLIRELWVCVLFESNGEGYGHTWDPPGARGA